MTYKEFVELCEREFANGGEVRELRLRQESWLELAVSVVPRGSWPAVTTLVNPATGRLVAITLHEDEAVVYRRPTVEATYVVKLSHSGCPVPPQPDQANA